MKRVVAGPRAVLEALRGPGAGAVAVVYLDPNSRPALREVAEAARDRGVRVEERTREEIDALADGVRHQGAVAISGTYAYASLDDLLAAAGPAPLFVALDEVTDPHNFGAIVRSAVALGADGVITLERRAAPVTPVVVRASAGATEHARIARVTNLSQTLVTLRKRGLLAVGLAAEGETTVGDLPAAPGGRVLVVGSEGRGLRRLVRERCDLLARIDLTGPIASLNASVAAGIALYEAARQRDEETAEQPPRSGRDRTEDAGR